MMPCVKMINFAKHGGKFVKKLAITGGRKQSLLIIFIDNLK